VEERVPVGGDHRAGAAACERHGPHDPVRVGGDRGDPCRVQAGVVGMA